MIIYEAVVCFSLIIISYYIGRYNGKREETDIAIQTTIDFFVKNNMVRYYYDSKNELHVLPLEEDQH